MMFSHTCAPGRSNSLLQESLHFLPLVWYALLVKIVVVLVCGKTLSQKVEQRVILSHHGQSPKNYFSNIILRWSVTKEKLGGLLRANSCDGEKCAVFVLEELNNHVPIRIPEESVVRTIGLILLSGKLINFFISSMVGIRSSAYCLTGGKPLANNSQETGILFILQNSLTALT